MDWVDVKIASGIECEMVPKEGKRSCMRNTKCKCSICLLANIIPGSAILPQKHIFIFFFFACEFDIAFNSSIAVVIVVFFSFDNIVSSTSSAPTHSRQVSHFLPHQFSFDRFNWEFPMALRDLTHSLHSIDLLSSGAAASSLKYSSQSERKKSAHYVVIQSTMNNVPNG